MAGSLNQSLVGRVEPPARSWKAATPAQKKDFYRHAGDLAVAEKRRELARGIGANGRRMAARKRARSDGAEGPVLTPHGPVSRTARLLAARVWEAGVSLFWHAGIRKGQRTPWGTILGFHADGRVRGAPARDVRLSTRGLNAVRGAMATWWKKYLRQEARKARKAGSGSGPSRPEPEPEPAPPRPRPRPPVPAPPKPKARPPVPEPRPEPTVPAETPDARKAAALARARQIAASHEIRTSLGFAERAAGHGYDEEKMRATIAFLDGNDGVIYLNPDHWAWSRTAREIEEDNRGRWLSSSHVDGTIHHEIGHALHRRSVGGHEFGRVGRGPFSPDRAEVIARNVSRYAATSEVEFVAEVYAGIRAGKQYGKSIMEFYESLGGPRP